MKALPQHKHSVETMQKPCTRSGTDLLEAGGRVQDAHAKGAEREGHQQREQQDARLQLRHLRANGRTAANAKDPGVDRQQLPAA